MRLTWLGLQPVKSAVQRTVSPEARSATMLWWAAVFGTRPAYLPARRPGEQRASALSFPLGLTFGRAGRRSELPESASDRLHQALRRLHREHGQPAGAMAGRSSVSPKRAHSVAQAGSFALCPGSVNPGESEHRTRFCSGARAYGGFLHLSRLGALNS
jgi:hypothetical protein